MCVIVFASCFGIQNKSELVRIGGIGDAGLYVKILGCKKVKFSFKYLGVPLGAKCNDQITWESVIDLFEKIFVGGREVSSLNGVDIPSLKAL